MNATETQVDRFVHAVARWHRRVEDRDRAKTISRVLSEMAFEHEVAVEQFHIFSFIARSHDMECIAYIDSLS